MTKEWFEMMDVRRRRVDEAVWIPLRANHPSTVGTYGYAGYTSEFFGVGSLAVPLDKRIGAEALRWHDLGLAYAHKGGVDRGRYVPADIFEDSRVGQALPLLLEQSGNSEDSKVWHLHQDLVVTLGLKREGDVWLAINEGYIEVARLRKGADGEPLLLEVRAEFLKDYLCARGMALYVSSYRSREEIVDLPSEVAWPENPFCPASEEKDRWEGRIVEIHEGGRPFGGSVKVFRVSRTDVDFGEDVPKIGFRDETVATESWTKEFKGPKLYRIRGELWRNEWVQPAKLSPRVRRDKPPASVFFITDSAGGMASHETLANSGRWLWFRPNVVMDLAQRRGGALRWCTRDTGAVRCSPDDSVHFGVNKLGLVNVYAKDIALLPEWQQRLWAGFNVGPDGGVSEELLESQAVGEPADTQAPEEFLPKAIGLLNEVSMKKFGILLFRQHEQFGSIVSRVHRFRSVDEPGFFSLAKDLARVTADSIDGSAIQKITVRTKTEKWGSLKSLENLVAHQVSETQARSLLGPLHGVYNLRHTDAHLPGREMDSAFGLVGVDRSLPFVMWGYQIIYSCVSALYEIAAALNRSDAHPTS
jgi:hypothetical protein